MSRARLKAEAEFVATPEQRALVAQTLVDIVEDFQVAEAIARAASRSLAARVERASRYPRGV